MATEPWYATTIHIGWSFQDTTSRTPQAIPLIFNGFLVRPPLACLPSHWEQSAPV